MLAHAQSSLLRKEARFSTNGAHVVCTIRSWAFELLDMYNQGIIYFYKVTVCVSHSKVVTWSPLTPSPRLFSLFGSYYQPTGGAPGKANAATRRLFMLPLWSFPSHTSISCV